MVGVVVVVVGNNGDHGTADVAVVVVDVVGWLEVDDDDSVDVEAVVAWTVGEDADDVWDVEVEVVLDAGKTSKVDVCSSGEKDRDIGEFDVAAETTTVDTYSSL